MRCRLSHDCDDTRDGLRRQRADPHWPYPYAPRPDYGLPAVWRGIVLLDEEWRVLAESTPDEMRVWEYATTTCGSSLLSSLWAETERYWTSRANSREDVMRILATELTPGVVMSGKLPHLCGRTNCPGDDAHKHPFFDRKPKSGHPSVVVAAGRQTYNSWVGDNMVFVEFEDGSRALFPGTWLRQMAEDGDRIMASLQQRYKT